MDHFSVVIAVNGADYCGSSDTNRITIGLDENIANDSIICLKLGEEWNSDKLPSIAVFLKKVVVLRVHNYI